ncbi:MAG: hypothetical protein IJQ89_06485 [Bacteroidales bacterium]|nr:hypothetical protein [Bacteroidales bacterium]
MENTTKIKQYIRHLAPQPYTEVHLAQVKSVEGDTCTILLDGLEIQGVSLRPVQDQTNQPLRITPAPVPSPSSPTSPKDTSGSWR